MSSIDRVAQGFRTARRTRSLSLRELEHEIQARAVQNPEQFEAISRSTLNNIEIEGEAFFNRPRSITPRKFAALVEVLWAGDMEGFTAATGISFRQHLGSEGAPAPRPLPLYVEGGEVDAADVRLGRCALRSMEPVLPGADLLLEVSSGLNQPVVWPEQVVGVRLTPEAEDRALHLLLVKNRLTLAWQVRPDVFAYTNVENGGQAVFPFRNGDAVLGVVHWIQPRLPNAAHG